MEEKERYVIRYDLDYNRCLIDTEENQGVGDYIQIVKLLNQQDKRIKELEEINKILSNELTKNSILKQDHIETCCGIPIFKIPKMKEENQQLKQQLADSEKRYIKAYQEGLLQKQFDKDMEIAELEQQLHDLPEKIVEEIRTYCNLKEFNPEFVDKEHQELVVSYTELIDFLDKILKKSGG